MAEIICVHSPRTIVGSEVKLTDGVMTSIETIAKTCPRCNTTWNQANPEPRVVIARLEETSPVS